MALFLFALGSGLYLRSAWDFAVFGRGTPAPIDAPKRLVTRGFYRYTRNPMYVASLSVVVGWATLFGAVILVSCAVLDLDVLLLACDLEGFGSLLGALRARHEEIHSIFDPV